MPQLQPFDVRAYEEQSKNDPCFICEMVAGNPNYRHHVIYEDQTAVAFLAKYSTLYGHTLVAPRQHHEQATGDFRVDAYLALHRLIYDVAEAIRHTVPTERIYILTLGSQQGNRHVHWHLAPLPPGVPYEKQQTAVLDLAEGILSLPDEEMASLARAVHRAMDWSNVDGEGGQAPAVL